MVVASFVGIAGVAFGIVSSVAVAVGYLLRRRKEWLWTVCLVAGGVSGALVAAAVAFWNSLLFFVTFNFNGQAGWGALGMGQIAMCLGIAVGILLGDVIARLLLKVKGREPLQGQ